MENETLTGTVKWFNDTKGFGFIAYNGGKEFFAHYSDVQMEGRKTLVENQRVSFEPDATDKGPRARKIRIL